MVDNFSQEDVPARVMELLRMFLAASSRGEQACLVLETRKRTVTTKFRSVETVAGNSATASPTTQAIKSKMNPARARRSKLRLEEFNRRKVEKKQAEVSAGNHRTGNQDVGSGATGDTSSTISKLVIELPKEQEKQVEKSITSPIPQVDGQEEGKEEKSTYTFVSDFGEEDIIYSLSEIFPEIETNLVSRVQLRPRSAHHMCTVTVLREGGQISWPEMRADITEVFQDLKRI